MNVMINIRNAKIIYNAIKGIHTLKVSYFIQTIPYLTTQTTVLDSSVLVVIYTNTFIYEP